MPKTSFRKNSGTIDAITPVSTRVNEGVGSVTFTVSRSGASAAETLYASTVQNHGTTNNGDYTGVLNEPLFFAVGETEQTVSVEVIDDAIVEDDETFGLIVQELPTDPIDIFLASATFTIADNDGLSPVVSRIVPTLVARNNPALFSVFGTGLPDGLVFDMVGCASAPELPGGTASIRRFGCTPAELGSFTATVADAQGNPVSGGAATINGVPAVEIPPELIDINVENEPSDPGSGARARKAVVITHGWNASVEDWVWEMAEFVCRQLGYGSVYPANATFLVFISR